MYDVHKYTNFEIAIFWLKIKLDWLLTKAYILQSNTSNSSPYSIELYYRTPYHLPQPSPTLTPTGQHRNEKANHVPVSILRK